MAGDCKKKLSCDKSLCILVTCVCEYVSLFLQVHSAQYRPGQDFVNDVEEEDESLFARSGNDSTTEASDDQGADGDINREGILTKVNN